ncbi:MAG: archease [Phycisphaerae bacterium]|nr:archease [Phycisphaerae bacterium]
MSKHCETFDHTADVGLAADGETLAELFEALAEGLAGVYCPPSSVRPAETRTVAVRAEDIEALTVDFLSDVLAVLEVERFAVAGCRVTDVDETHVAAELSGEPLDRAHHEIGMEVKAVTYHELAIARDAHGWHGRVILDV